MRIGSYELREIKNRILKDLYGKREEELTKRRNAIAKQNRKYFLAPLEQYIDQLPEQLITHSNEYMVKIKYHPQQNPLFIQDPNEINNVCEDDVVTEYWIYKTKDKIINPVDPKGSSNNYYSKSPEQPLDSRLYDEAIELCKDILVYRKDYQDMNNYLTQTTAANQGSIKLRGVWPSGLHKFLPPEPTKLPKKGKGTKKVVVDTPEVPKNLEIQLTENLLEGN